MRNHGFDVTDLGKDVSPQKIVAAAKERGAALVALSALMTTTMPKMRETVELLRAEGMDIPVMVGGAAVDQEFAEAIGAYYSSDAAGAVKVAQTLTER
jgi:5-methyltetrahydrofolate--homocysteine methyltransferase